MYYYICSSIGTFNVEMRDNFVSNGDYLISAFKELNSSISGISVIDDNEGKFLCFLVDDKMCLEYKMFSTTRKDFIEEVEEKKVSTYWKCLIM